jgi:hypothetical protein
MIMARRRGFMRVYPLDKKRLRETAPKLSLVAAKNLDGLCLWNRHAHDASIVFARRVAQLGMNVPSSIEPG